jgi:DNA processing protein
MENLGDYRKNGKLTGWGIKMSQPGKKSEPDLYDLLYLLTIPNIGPGRIRRLFQTFQNAQEILKSPMQKLICLDGIDYKLASQIKQGGDSKKADEQFAIIRDQEIKYVTIWDKNYPSLLKRIADPPLMLFYKGTIKDEGIKRIAVVGMRNPSQYGKIVTADIVGKLVMRNISIVSGLARGIDTIAHHAAIQGGGETIAVLGCGIDKCYPPENRKLWQEIEETGLILSEYFMGTEPDAANFPKRNRIISGISQGTLVVEAGERSGALISALFALNQNREVFAIPGQINNPKSLGTNRLIKQGAKLVQSVEDILEELGDKFSTDLPHPKPVPQNLRPFECKLLENLTGDPKHIDKIVLDLEESPSTVLSSLLSLELLGLVQQLAGKMFVRI